MESPLHTSLLRFTIKRRRLLSSEDEDNGRTDEGIIHSDCVAKQIFPSSSLTDQDKDPGREIANA